MSITHHLPFARSAVAVMLATTLTASLTGCGSDGSTTVPTTSSINGTVFAAAVSGASCEILDSTGKKIAGPFTSSSTGAYSVDIADSSLANDLMLICDGGIYTDEATGSSTTAGAMAAYAAGGTLGSTTGLHATPESTVIHQLVTQYGMTLADANTAFNTAFGYTPDSTVAPTDATNPANDAGLNELQAGLRAAAFSQLTFDLGLDAGQQFALLEALAQDLSNGTLDGMDASGAITIAGTTIDLPADPKTQFESAVSNFNLGTTLTSSYKVEYVVIPMMMDAKVGKSVFNIRLTDRSNDQPVSGETVTLMPMMYMPDDRKHSTPVDGACAESATPGTYDCTVYYLMPSSMDGLLMGYWDLKVMIGGMMGETAHFYPSVMMAMGGTTRADLKGVDDQLMNMMSMMEDRRYLLFNSKLSGSTDNHKFEIFIAAAESMMSFPALVDGLVLNAGETYELTAGTIIVEMSTDKSTWVTATDDGAGYRSASNLTGLTTGVEGNIYVKLSVSGEQKSTNGEIDNGMTDETANGYATFTVTPGSM